MSAQNDSAFLRMFLLVIGALVAFTIIIVIAARSVTGDLDENAAGDSRLQAEIERRIAPVGEVAIVDASAGPAPKKTGKEVVTAVCSSCHGTGVLGAPKIGDGAAWKGRMAKAGGVDGLLKSAIAGVGAMPARGGAADLSDEELHDAIVEMLKESNVEVAEADTAAPEAAATEPQASSTAQNPVAAAASGAAKAMSNMMGAARDTVSNMAQAVAPQPAMDLAKGQQVYQAACFACHATGAAGAPKLTDKAAWAPRLAEGLDALYSAALNGKGAMPAKGGRPDLSDDDVKAAVAYMAKQVQ